MTELLGFFLFFFLIGVLLFYNVVLVSVYSEVEFPVLYSRFLLVIYFIHISVYMCDRAFNQSFFFPWKAACSTFTARYLVGAGGRWEAALTTVTVGQPILCLGKM